MKLSTITHALGAIALGAAAFAAHATPVLVFDNASYVDTTGNYGAESDTIQASLVKGGYSVNTFTSLSAAGLSTALAGQHVLLIPEQQNGAMTTAMDTAALDVVRTFVANGGGLIISSDYRSTLNTLFGYKLTYSGASTSTLTAAAAGTAFAGGPVSLPTYSATQGFNLASLPTGATSIYTAGNLSTVTVFHYGQGQIVQLGWDWYNAAPLGTVDGGWLSVLNRSVEEVSKVPEPGSLPLVAVALAACALVRRRRG